jgi:hypothetical protein
LYILYPINRLDQKIKIECRLYYLLTVNMGNTSKRTSRGAYVMPKYTRMLTSSGTGRFLKSYLSDSFNHLCGNIKFNVYQCCYNNPDFIACMITVSYLESPNAVLPIDRNIDIIGCSKITNEFLLFDRKKRERIVVSASSVFTDLLTSFRYNTISKLLLKKLIRYKIISKSDAKMIWQDLDN